MSGAHSPNAPDRVAAAVKTLEALKLRIQHKSYEQIARELGYADRSGAYQAVKRELAAIKAESAELHAEVMQIDLERLDRAGELAMKKIEDGDLTAIDKLIKILERRAAMFGLDAKDNKPTEPAGTTTYNVTFPVMTAQEIAEQKKAQASKNDEDPEP